jgi:hypothetical protein
MLFRRQVPVSADRMVRSDGEMDSVRSKDSILAFDEIKENMR